MPVCAASDHPLRRDAASFMPVRMTAFFMPRIDPAFLLIALFIGAVTLTVSIATLREHLKAKREQQADAQRQRDLFKRFPDRQ